MKVTVSQIRRIVYEYLAEAESEKQRRWACAQAGSARKKFKGKPSLTKKQAAEFCADTKLSGKKKKKK